MRHKVKPRKLTPVYYSYLNCSVLVIFYPASFVCVRVFSCISAQVSHSVMSDSATPWTAAHRASLSITNSQSLLKLTSIT